MLAPTALARTALAPHAIAHWAEQCGEQLALQHIGGEQLTYSELHHRVMGWAGALDRIGVDVGTHVATMLDNTPVAHVAMAALGWHRAIEVPINTAFRGQMLRYALDLTDATHLITESAYLPLLAEVIAELPMLGTVVVVGAGSRRVELGNCTVVTLEEFLADAPTVELPGPQVWDVACLLFTSGTTGPSKAVICPWGLVYQMWGWVPPDTVAHGAGVMNSMPMFHNSGRSGFNFAMASGARFIFRDRFSATELWNDTRRYQAEVVALVGPMPRLLAAAAPSPDDADNPVRSVVLGPMIPDMEVFETRFGVRVCTSYGQTEIGCPLDSGWDHGPWTTCGAISPRWPYPEVRLVDEFDQPVGTGEVGEMIVRTGEPWALNLGYYKMPEVTVEAWRNGWFHTGDAFRLDDHERYTFVDRMRDTIRRRGENISSFDVEAAVMSHPAVREVAAVGIATELGDDEVLITVILHEGATLDPHELIEFLAPRMARFMVPRYVELVDDLPRNTTTGRVRKNELRARGLTEYTWDRMAAEMEI